MDESLNLCQAVTGGNSSSMGFILMPQAHSSTTHTAIVKNRRLLEDKALSILGCMIWRYLECLQCSLCMKSSLMSVGIFYLRCSLAVASAHKACCVCWKCAPCNPRGFDLHEVALIYNTSSHQGDKRKTSQQCVLAKFLNGQIICKTLRFGSDLWLTPHCGVPAKPCTFGIHSPNRQIASFRAAKP